MVTDVDQITITSTIRRMLRILGAMPSHESDPEAVALAAQFVHDRMARTKKSMEWFEPDGHAPLVVAGDGPVLLVSYLDDADPFASGHSGQPPSFRETTVGGPGIIRKAGVVAAAAAELDDERGGRFTLVVETDRNAGSLTLEAWLREHSHRFDAAIWEITDLPAPAPLIAHSAAGWVTLKVTANANHHYAESQYGGVVPDLGRQFAAALADIVSSDHEVRLDGFYDDIDEVDEQSLEVIHEVGDLTAAWLRRVVPDALDMPSSHLAMGVYLAPGVIIRQMSVQDRPPYLSVAAEAILDIQLVPGQDVQKILESVIRFFADRLPGTTVEPMLVRPPVTGKANIAALREAYPRVLKTVPGLNPAGMIESFGIPTVGYASVRRNPDNTSGRVALEEVINGARLIQTLSRRMAG